MNDRSGICASATRVFAIAALSFRAASRSRLLLCMAAVLLVVTFGLPATVEGDGTLAGRVRMLLDYTLGLSTLALGVAILWAACAGVSKEIELGHLRLVAVRPVRPLEIWFGKWLGLLALSALLLAIAGAGTYGQLQWQLRRAGVGAEARTAVDTQILVGQRRMLPEPESVAADVETRVEELARQGLWRPELMPRTKAVELVARQLRAERAAVAAGATRRWTIRIPANAPALRPATLRVHVSPTSGDIATLTGAWTLTPMERPDAAWTTTTHDYRHGIARLILPANFVRPGETLRVDYANPDGSGTVIFDVEHGVELLIAESGFGANLVRALLVVWCRIGLLCAFGLAAGTCFSFPVAAFTASAIVLLSMTGHFFVAADWAEGNALSAGSSSASTAIQRWSEPVIHALERLVLPAINESSLDLLSDGILVSWGWTVHSAILLLGLYAGILAAAASLILRRRELG